MKPGEAMQKVLTGQYDSSIIEKMKKAGGVYVEKDMTFHLAESFGFCYGVDRAVDLAYATREKYPQARLFLTTEIIHNPRVNKNLLELGYQFLSGPYKGDVTIDDLTADDVVVIPAFGTDLQTLKKVSDKGCQIVETTCGSVLNIWRRVESYTKEGYTVVIHGKYYHEETQATSSRVMKSSTGKYLVVLNMEEADIVANYIRHGGDKEKFLQRFSKAVSSQFDPDKDLQRIGLANQTTMLGSESLCVADHLKQAVVDRYGEETLEEHFRSFETICSATDDRQTAVMKLEGKDLDLMIVVGGYNSSNTNQLCYITSQFTKTYHIENHEELGSEQIIRHKPHGQWETIVTEDWLPSGPVNIGITAGASTPDKVIGDVIEKILTFR